jgi:hypothetical protein
MVLFDEINLFLVRGVLEKDPLKLGRRWKQSWERDLSLIITIGKYIIGKCSNVEHVVNGESLVIRRFFNVQVNEEDIRQYRENIFHIRCHIKNKVCSMIMDNGSCTNVASTNLVRKLNLTTIKHVILYKLEWLKWMRRI